MAIPKILLVEDDPRARARLERSLGSCEEFRLQAAVENCVDARRQLDTSAPDVLVTDLGLPDGSGVELIRALRKLRPESLSMVVTVLGDEKTVVEALEAGASGYLLKDEPPEVIAEGVRQLLAGGSPISPSIARHLLRRFRPQPSAPEPTADTPKLTDREREILALAAKGFRQKEIADLLDVSPHTVRTHVRHIYEKLEVHSRSAAIYEAVNLGLLDLQS